MAQAAGGQQGASGGTTGAGTQGEGSSGADASGSSSQPQGAGAGAGGAPSAPGGDAGGGGQGPPGGGPPSGSGPSHAAGRSPFVGWSQCVHDHLYSITTMSGRAPPKSFLPVRGTTSSPSMDHGDLKAFFRVAQVQTFFKILHEVVVSSRQESPEMLHVGSEAW